MSVPFIQLGQCGNQIGRKFYQVMFDQGAKSSDAHQSLLESFFYIEDPKNIKAKAFSIDMEPKVVQKNLQMRDSWSYDKQLSLVQEQGSGNNWAYGCHVHGPKNRQALEDLFQKYAEKQDYIECFVQVQSMAGGTGSGLGTYIIQLLNQHFSKTPKFVACVMPHLSGEVILQSYNASLSLGTVYPEADGIFVIENDQVAGICSKIMNQQKSSLDDINQIIGRNLASVFFPAISKNTDKIFSVEQNQFPYSQKLIGCLFHNPKYKLCSIKTVPHGPKNYEAFNSDNWQSLENDLFFRKKHKSFAELIIARGSDHPNTFARGCPVVLDKHNFYNYSKSLTVLDNGQQFISPLEQILDRAYSMLKENSYVYQYEKYGLQKENFLQCFAQIENIQGNYSKL